MFSNDFIDIKCILYDMCLKIRFQNYVRSKNMHEEKIETINGNVIYAFSHIANIY